MWSARCAFHTFLAREGAANKFQKITHEFVSLFFKDNRDSTERGPKWRRRRREPPGRLPRAASSSLLKNCVRWRRDCVLRAPRLSADCWRPQPLARPLFIAGGLNPTLWAARSTPRDNTAFVVVFCPPFPPYPPFSTARGIETLQTPQTASCAILFSELRRKVNKIRTTASRPTHQQKSGRSV